MQLILSASAFLGLVVSAVAIQVTAPAERSIIDLSKETTISWASVETDPSSFKIVLTNMNVNPPVSIDVASNVATSDGSYDVSAIEGATPGGNYRINLVSTQSGSQILAQSGQFSVADAGSSSTSLASFSGSTSSTSEMVTTSTITSTISSSGSMTTITSTGTSTSMASSSRSSSESSSESSASASASESAASESAASASASATGAASSLNTFAGAGVLAMVAALLA